MWWNDSQRSQVKPLVKMTNDPTFGDYDWLWWLVNDLANTATDPFPILVDYFLFFCSIFDSQQCIFIHSYSLPIPFNLVPTPSSLPLPYIPHVNDVFCWPTLDAASWPNTWLSDVPTIGDFRREPDPRPWSTDLLPLAYDSWRWNSHGWQQLQIWTR